MGLIVLGICIVRLHMNSLHTGSSGFPPRPCFIFEAVSPPESGVGGGGSGASGGNVSNSAERKRCLLCGKVVSNDYQHYRVHFPGNYPCNICQSLFKRKDYWKTHMRKQHGASFPTASEKASERRQETRGHQEAKGTKERQWIEKPGIF